MNVLLCFSFHRPSPLISELFDPFSSPLLHQFLAPAPPKMFDAKSHFLVQSESHRPCLRKLEGIQVMNFTVTTAREKKWVADWSRERENNEIRQVYCVSSVVYRLQLPRDKRTPKPTRPSHMVLAEVPGGTGCPELCPLVSVCCHSTEGPCLVDSRHFQKPLAAQGAL